MTTGVSCRLGSRFPGSERIVRIRDTRLFPTYLVANAKGSGCKTRLWTSLVSWTLTQDTSRTDERYRKQVDNGLSRGAKGTIDVSRYTGTTTGPR